MKITYKLDCNKLKNDYDLVVGWGVARNEYERKYNPLMYQLDYMIDGMGRCVGDIICGNKIWDKDILKELVDQKILFVVFPNIENSVIEYANQIGIKRFDTIVSRLIDFKANCVRTFSENYEDVIFLEVMKRLGIDSPYYVDIGVCHPVLRNNTYLMYEKNMCDGLLVEPNLEMCELIEEYRPHNTLVRGGVCGGVTQTLKYYMNSEKSWVGHNTFSYEEAVSLNIQNNYIEMKAYNINEFFEIYAEKCPDILDIDVEGMDEEVIRALDTERFRAKIISIEELVCGSMRQIMESKGYVHFAGTAINGIYVAKEILECL